MRTDLKKPLAATPDTYLAIKREIESIRLTMTLYAQLYCRDADTAETLNRAAGAGFRCLQPSLARDILLSIIRLCDPATSKFRKEQRENCTFARLIDLVEQDGKRDLANWLHRLFTRVIRPRCNNLLILRNRRLAHNDHQTLLSNFHGPDSLQAISVRDAHKVVRSMRKLLLRVGEVYGYDVFHERFAGPRFGNEIRIPGRDFNYMTTCLKAGPLPEYNPLEDLF